MNIACDESNDGTTCAIAGWVAYPDVWDKLSVSWRQMLDSFTMPDGSKMPSFHAAEIVGRDSIKDSRFKGWDFEQEVKVFTAAIDILTDASVRDRMRPFGCSIVLPPSDFTWIKNNSQDTLWYLLFTRVLHILVVHFPDCYDCDLIFDDKPSIRQVVHRYYEDIKKLVHSYHPGKFSSPIIAFGEDESNCPLQIADLLAYEWRKRTSDRILTPLKRVRPPFARLKDAYPQGRLQCYDKGTVEAIMEKIKSNPSSDMSFIEYLNTWPIVEE